MPQKPIHTFVGLKAKVPDTVTEDRLATTLGSGNVRVYGTPAMAALMEQAAVEALEQVLPSKYTSVGIWLDLKHEAPTPLGMDVIAIAEVVDVEDSVVSFEISVWDEVQEVGTCFHQRALVERDVFQAHADAKLTDPRRYE